MSWAMGQAEDGQDHGQEPAGPPGAETRVTTPWPMPSTGRAGTVFESTSQGKIAISHHFF
jgi:hypothetical protein